MTQFAEPSAPGTGISFKDYLGALLLIDVLGVEDHVPTVHSKPGEKSPAVRADVTILDGTSAGESFADTLIFPKVLQSQLKKQVGQKVLGRLSQGQAKPGQSAPWVIDAPTDADKAAATAFLNRTVAPAPPF